MAFRVEVTPEAKSDAGEILEWLQSQHAGDAGLSWNEIRVRAARFAEEWKDAHYERGESQTFYNEFFEVFGVTRRRVATFEEPVKRLGKSSASRACATNCDSVASAQDGVFLRSRGHLRASTAVKRIKTDQASCGGCRQQ